MAHIHRRLGRGLLAGCLGVAAHWAVPASADTVYFKDGTSLDGEVSRPNDNSIVLQAGNARLTFSVSEIDRIEENDRTGADYDLNAVMAAERQAEMREVTGLTAEQREEVRQVLELLKSPEADIRRRAQEQLVNMSASMDVFQYLEAKLPFQKGPVTNDMMEAMILINPDRAGKALQVKAYEAVPSQRAKALELLGKTKSGEAVETVARGMVDAEASVRLAAAQALGEAGDKRATPVLIEGLTSNDAQLRNASRTALSRIWSSGEVRIDHESADAWRTYWSSQAGSVSGAVNVNQLEPLYVPGPPETDIIHHE